MSKYVVSARKYRPRRFEEVVGQQHVTRTLKNALQQDQLAHAFLFCGPRGVGKTTCARILAKVLNCENVRDDYEPCDECPSCQSFNQHATFNITELDAASNNSVEHIRALIEQVRFQPQQGRYKIFIIDEVHMLSQQAFNAFLKTLEEPPPYALFILATTEKHKIIPTILSRCQIYDFKRIQVPEMAAHLQHICTQEHIEADPEALHVIAQKADGALRDSLSILDRMVAFSGQKITYQDIIDNLNVLDYDYFFQAVDALLTEDVSQMLLLLDQTIRLGFDPDLFMNGLAGHLRNLLVSQDEQTLDLLELSESLRQRYLEQARLIRPSLLLTALNLANECDVNYKMARNKRLHVEMALIRMTFINRAVQWNENTFAAAEKKTADPSVEAPERNLAAQNPPADAPATAEHESHTAPPPKTTPSAPESAPVTDRTPHAETEKNTPVTPSASPSTKPAPEPEAGHARLKGTQKHGYQKVNLDDLHQQLRQEAGDEVVNQDLTLEDIQHSWKAYREKVDGDFVKSCLQQASLEFENRTVIARVGTSVTQSALQAEASLLYFLKKALKAPDLRMKVILDKEKAPKTPKPRKPLTNKERFRKLEEVNPLIREMQQRLGLRFDEE